MKNYADEPKIRDKVEELNSLGYEVTFEDYGSVLIVNVQKDGIKWFARLGGDKSVTAILYWIEKCKNWVDKDLNYNEYAEKGE